MKSRIEVLLEALEAWHKVHNAAPQLREEAEKNLDYAYDVYCGRFDEEK